MRLAIGAALSVFVAGFIGMFLGDMGFIWFIASAMIFWIVYELEAIRKHK
ncbi:hypothetical protein [Oscillibacter sp.]|nr:hypothetical protein [Oscillibacter sp.]